MTETIIKHSDDIRPGIDRCKHILVSNAAHLYMVIEYLAKNHNRVAVVTDMSEEEVSKYTGGYRKLPYVSGGNIKQCLDASQDTMIVVVGPSEKEMQLKMWCSILLMYFDNIVKI